MNIQLLPHSSKLPVRKRARNWRYISGIAASLAVIMNNGEEIYIGLSYDANNGCYLFVSGSPNAFK